MQTEPYVGDLQKTQILYNLFNTPHARRDDAWKLEFLANVADASFVCGDPQVINGPDGFPYFVLNLPEPGKPFTCFVIRHLVKDYLIEHGFGIVIEPGKAQPEWVFSHGDVVNFHLKGTFYEAQETPVMNDDAIIRTQTQVLITQPSEAYLPAQTRKVMRQFLEYHRLDDPKILLMTRPTEAGMIQELVFNIEMDRIRDQERYNTVMQQLGWFLPRGYRYTTMDEQDGLDFEPL